ncbi:MAG: SCO family protein [Proteobacteria bacterium]|nr:SCO family protein [Pseudomonadota bacterium]
MARLILFAAFVAAISVATFLGLWSGQFAARFANEPETAGVGEALIGGPFTLISQHGATVTEADLLGHWSIVYFGYTFCPDVCPVTLQNVTLALEMLGGRASRVVPYFITVDPWRDTPEVMAEYATYFHAGLKALSGTPEQIAAAAAAFRVYYSPTERPETEDYFVDHTSILYLLGPDGRYVSHFSHTTAVDEIADRLARAL